MVRPLGIEPRGNACPNALSSVVRANRTNYRMCAVHINYSDTALPPRELGAVNLSLSLESSRLCVVALTAPRFWFAVTLED